jgi:hypothetical protein
MKNENKKHHDLEISFNWQKNCSDIIKFWLASIAIYLYFLYFLYFLSISSILSEKYGSRMVPNQPMERVSVYMFLVCDKSGTAYMAEISGTIKCFAVYKIQRTGEYLILSDSLSSIGPIKYQRGRILLFMSARKSVLAAIEVI